MSRYQLLPPLGEDEYAALRDDIKSAGVRVPIDVDETGDILDGHHRKQICDELGIECPERVIRDLPDFAKVDYALTVNLTRRHLDRDGRRQLVVRSLKRDPRLSDREHARRCGVSHPYVAGIREALEAAEQLETVTNRQRRGGGTYPSERAQDHRVATPVRADPEPPRAGVDSTEGSTPAPLVQSAYDTPAEADAASSAAEGATANAPSAPSPGSEVTSPTSDPDHAWIAEWRAGYRAKVRAARDVMRRPATEVAEYAGVELIDELFALAVDIANYAEKVSAAN